MRQAIWVCVVAAASAGAARAGYEQPNYIDGCQSIDGRYVVTAECVERSKTVHGPNKWKFHWKDTKENKSRSFDPVGVQSGQVYGQLFISPDGERIALFNHFTLWCSPKSNMHGPPDLVHHEDTDVWRSRDEFKKRILIWNKDGALVKELGVGDIVRPEEWSIVLRVFNRVQWLEGFDGMSYRSTPRMQYALYRVSPDYTVLELRIPAPRGAKSKTPRTVRVSLTDGRILAEDEKLVDPNKIPARPFHGPDKLEDSQPSVREGYVPSLDPVRGEGAFTVAQNPPPTLKLIKDGYKKADTPAWLPKDQILVFTDLEQNKLFKVGANGEVSVAREGAGRGKVGPDGRFYGVFGTNLASWRPGEEPTVILEKAAGGKELSLNDITVGPKALYFTTLKDPEKGRVTLVDLASKKATVVFDGEEHPELSNPNGIALAPDGKFLYVAISNYKDRKKAGVYRFPIQADGTLDVAAGKKKVWGTANAPDGVAIAPDGRVFVTDGAVIKILNTDGSNAGSVKVPKDSATNLAFGGEGGNTLYVTTFRALYVGETPMPKRKDI